MKKIFKFIPLLSTLAFSSCLEKPSPAQYGTVKDFTIIHEEFIGCEDSFLIISILHSQTGCLDACLEQTHIATEEEIDYFKVIYREEFLTEKDDELVEDKDILLFQEIENSLGLCLDDIVKIERPTNEVFVKNDFCACLKGRPDILNNCSQACSSTSGNKSVLKGSVTLGPSIQLSSTLGDLYNWCTKEIDDGRVTPSCNLELFDGENAILLPLTISSGSNKFSVNISNIPYDKTYVARIIENGSGSNATSTSFQIRKKLFEVPSTLKRPLSITPISQYTCIQRSGVVKGGTSRNTYEELLRFHYYYPIESKPPPLNATNDFLSCHDIDRYGDNDHILYDRLELISHHFRLWNVADPRFYDLDKNAIPDINTEIEKRLKDDFNVTSTLNLFNLLQWPNRPNASTADSTGSSNLGFYLQPYLEKETGRLICPRYDEEGLYYREDPLFKVLNEIIGIDTEGIYMGAREGKTMLDSKGALVEAPIDILFVREGLLKKIWFYFEDQKYIIPQEATVGKNTLHFYWPPDTEYPYIEKSYQELYTVRSPDNIGKGIDTNGLITTIRSPDKKFGCIPVL